MAETQKVIAGGIGYSAGQDSANLYLRNIAIFLTVNNIFDRNLPFEYAGSQNAFAYEANSINPPGRVWHAGGTKQF